jgi:hypothetical protein
MPEASMASANVVARVKPGADAAEIAAVIAWLEKLREKVKEGKDGK